MKNETNKRVIKVRIWTPKPELVAGGVMSGIYPFGSCPYIDDNDVLLQFTGLIDGNGKEIYDGDILDDDMLRAVVFWCNREYGWRLKDADGECLSCTDGFPMGIVNGLFTVIGDVYRSPERVLYVPEVN